MSLYKKNNGKKKCEISKEMHYPTYFDCKNKIIYNYRGDTWGIYFALTKQLYIIFKIINGTMQEKKKKYNIHNFSCMCKKSITAIMNMVTW